MTLFASLLAAAALLASPFPPPKLAPQTDQLKCDTGVVVAADSALGQLRVNTPAGLVIFKAPSDTQVVGADGKPGGTVKELAPGQKVRVYYVVDDGARASEVALE
ncbi:MAG: hypothetical protein HY901_03670 [Deltaproteobacteria bacterium]|nr:hypothetical protein [Deltaproteobacteria bacterium]